VTVWRTLAVSALASVALVAGAFAVLSPSWLAAGIALAAVKVLIMFGGWAWLARRARTPNS
jgi:hypothetical protein